jgi:hypothetical protein
MSSGLYVAYNAAVPTTAAMVKVSTGTAIKTLLQVTAPSTRQLTIVEWGITFDGSPAAIQCELINTTTVAGGTPTAVTPTVLTAGAPASLATAGWSPTTEGTVVATTRVFDHQILSTNNYKWESSLGRESIVDVSQVIRVRVTAAAAVNATCWIKWEE